MTVNGSALFIPSETNMEQRVLLNRPVCAIQLIQRDDGTAKLGLLSQLGAGTEVKICGNGFNERTVKVRAHGSCYFVFRHDVMPDDASASN
jgi:hypothetical protein